MLTSILRDSLGGNCKTTMIANVSFDKVDVTESISTLRFSQNVASIKNNYRVNEEQDPSLIIKRLRKEIETLKNEIRLLKGGNERGPLSLEEKEYVKNQVELFVTNRENEDFIPDDNNKIKESFKIMKEMILNGGGAKNLNKHSDDSTDVRDLKMKLKQKDNEINILMNIIRKKGMNPEDGQMIENVIQLNTIKNDKENKMPELNESIIEHNPNESTKNTINTNTIKYNKK